MSGKEGKKDLEQNKAVLRAFLKDTDSLDKLEELADKENIFDILAIGEMEIRHSNFIAWLSFSASPLTVMNVWSS